MDTHWSIHSGSLSSHLRLRRCSDGVPIELERRHNVLPTIIALTAVQQVGLVEERQLVWLEHSRIFVSVHLK